jgi:hypothetical protein
MEEKCTLLMQVKQPSNELSKKSEVIEIIDNYFHWNNCVSAKNKKFGMVKHFYYLSSIGALKAPCRFTFR